MYIMSFYLMVLSIYSFMMSIIFMMMKINLLMNWTMMKLLSFKIEYIIYLDFLSLMFMSVVMLISSMVIMYSKEYMFNHPYIKRFMILITIFFISMMMMIMSPNIFSILLGWDGLGLSSYCLIIFYQNKKSFNSGMTTILMNRIGDINILIMISMLINKNSMNFMFLNKMNFIIMMFMLMAAITKSAQIPFSTWLPLAMAAPTPVSSLVHSSTLVTAGIYLMIRFNYIINNMFLSIIMLISMTTTMLASSSAMLEYDLKKIIALSTLSQLGLMFLTISMKLPNLAFFHLSTHAMFKSLLFLCSGIIIHNYFGNQDIRFISMINLNMPITNLIFNLSSLTLCGMPFLSGFYSKDLIIEMFNMNKMNFFIFNMMYLSMMMTIMYSFRLILYVSIKPMKLTMMNKFKMNNTMNHSIYLLFIMSITYGSMMNWIMFNATNIIIMNSQMKMLIYKIMFKSLIMSMTLPMIIIKTKKIMLLTIYFMNQMWLLPMMMKKNKINLFMLNNKLYYIKDLSWLELMTPQTMYFSMMKIKKLKNINKLNFSLLMILLSYMLTLMI